MGKSRRKDSGEEKKVEKGDAEEKEKASVHSYKVSIQLPPKLNRFLNGLIITTYEFF